MYKRFKEAWDNPDSHLSDFLSPPLLLVFFTLGFILGNLSSNNAKSVKKLTIAEKTIKMFSEELPYRKQINWSWYETCLSPFCVIDNEIIYFKKRFFGKDEIYNIRHKFTKEQIKQLKKGMKDYKTRMINEKLEDV